jgi:hypothetical protein
VILWLLSLTRFFATLAFIFGGGRNAFITAVCVCLCCSLACQLPTILECCRIRFVRVWPDRELS